MDSSNGTGVAKPKVGRPTKLNQHLADAICERIAEGWSLRKVCAEPTFPSATAVVRWLHHNPEFNSQYAKAREEQADYYADQIVEISDAAATGEQAAIARVRVDARKWVCSKFYSRRYADKTGDIHVNSTVNNFVVVTEERRAQIMERTRAALEQ